MRLIGKREAVGFVVILAIFAVGVIGYVLFSEDKPDGLERTMELAGIDEEEAHYRAPLDYGDGYFEYVAMGVVGAITVLLISLGVFKLMTRRNET